MSSLLIASIIFFTIIAIVRTEIAVFFIIALLPSYLIRFSLLGIPFTFLEAMILITFAIWFIKNCLPNLKTLISTKSFPRFTYPFRWEIIAIVLISFLAVANSNFSTSALGIWKAYFFEPVLLYILIINLWPKLGRNRTIYAFMLGAGSVSLLAIFQQITGLTITNEFWANEESRRVVSFFGYPNAVGLYLAPLIPIFLGMIFFQSSKDNRLAKYLSIGMMTISLLSVFFAKSEGALIGLAAALFIFCLFANKILRLVVISIAAIAIVIVFTIPSSRQYASDKVLLRDLSGEIRKQQWRETIMTFTGWNIITGNGLSEYQTAVKPFHQEGIFFNRDKMENFHSILYGSTELRAKYWQPVEIYMYPHNIFLNFWTELGLLGALIFTWLIIKYLFVSYKLAIKQTQINYFALGLFCAMIVIIIHGLVDVPYFKNDLSAMFFILLALLGVMTLNTNQKINY